MGIFVLSDAEIQNPIFGNMDMQSWALSASNLSLGLGDPVDEWIATGSAPAIVREFNDKNVSPWGFPTFDPTGGPSGGPAVAFDGNQGIMTQQFPRVAGPHTIVVIARADNPSSPTGIAARVWSSGEATVPSIGINADDTFSALYRGNSVALPNPHTWLGIGLAWDSDGLTFVTSASEPVTMAFGEAPFGLRQNIIGCSVSSSGTPNAMRGAVSRAAHWDRKLSASEMRSRMAEMM